MKRSGGGIQSNKLVQSQKGKQEPVSHRGNVAGVAQQGIAAPFVKEPIISGKGFQPYGPKDHTKAAHPKLAVTAQITENDFATLLDRRIQRYQEMKLIEHQPPQVEVKPPAAERMRRRI